VSAYTAVNFGTTVTSTSTTDDGIPTAVTLVPNGTSDLDLIARMLSTDDFYNSRGGTNVGFVTGLYQTLIGRDPEPEGLASWVKRLNQGQTRVQVVSTFERTAEALQVKVAHWYKNLFRLPNPIEQLKFDPGVIHWSRFLAAGQSDNTVLARILATNDYFVATGGSNESFVADLYRSLLEREADPESRNFFLGLLQGGMTRFDLVLRFEATVEAKRTKVARWYQNDLGWSLTTDQLKSDPGVVYWSRFMSDV